MLWKSICILIDTSLMAKNSKQTPPIGLKNPLLSDINIVTY